MTRKKHRWTVGDLFVVPLNNGKFCLGQIIGREAEVLNSVSIALFEISGDLIDLKEATPQMRDVFSVLFVTRDLLDSGRWPILGPAEVFIPRSEMPYENLRSGGFIGAKVRGSKNVGAFVNAFLGLAVWDQFLDPDYLDQFLLSLDKKPASRLHYKES